MRKATDMMRWLFVAVAWLAISTTAFAQAVGTNIIWTAVTCGASSTSFSTGSPFPVPSTSIYLSVQIPPTGVNVCFGWGLNTATTTPPSQCYTPGTVVVFPKGGTGSCIVASGTQAITVGYQ